MKKTLTLAALVFGAVASTYAQGTVIFATTASASTKVSTNSVVGGPSSGLTGANPGATYYYALFYSANNSTTVSGSSAAVVGAGNYAFNDSADQWTFVSYGINNSAGKFASSGTVNSDGTTTIPTVAAAATGELVAIGWSANIGSTIQSLQTYLASPGAIGWVGESAVASITLGNAPGTGSQAPESLFGSGAGQVGGLLLGEIAPVSSPEPGTIALAGLGGLALLGLRRKK